MAESEKRKKRLIRGLMLTGVILILCYGIIVTILPFPSPFSFWWVIRTALWLSGVVVLCIAVSYLAKPSERKTNDFPPPK
jgi:uncharacterized membrane protein HdeD (DUF308 family)